MIKPILFSGEMVRALLAGRKTQTRRVIKPRADGAFRIYHLGKNLRGSAFNPDYQFENGTGLSFTKYTKGDLLWVREAWQATWGPRWANGRIVTKASVKQSGGAIVEATPDDPIHVHYPIEGVEHVGVKWRPSIHMPRWANRITLEVTDVRVQRLQDVSEADAKAEGLKKYTDGAGWEWWSASQHIEPCGDPVEAFQKLWNGINLERAPWHSNPWVAAYTFRVIAQNVDEVPA